MLRIIEEAARTDTGRQRHANEDSYFARAPVFVIADGMGGAQAGEVASRIAADAFDEQLEGDNTERALAERAREANRRIFDLARQDESRSGMGTTLTAAALAGDDVSIVHVGDSRAYLFRDGELRQLTRDHSLVEELRRQGRLTSEEAEEHPQRSIITRALGPEPEVEPDSYTHQARRGDIYLLCSDGLTSMVREQVIRDILAASTTLQEAVDRLVAAANEAGGRDNITVVCFRIGGTEEKSRVSASGNPGALVAGPVANGQASDAEFEDDPDKTLVDLNVADLEREKNRDSASGITGGVERDSVSRPGPVRRVPASQRAAKPKKERRWVRRTITTLAVLIVLGAAAYGVNYALHHVYFIGQDEHGLVAVYRGMPYELPGGIKLYSERYVSSVPAAGLSPVERQRLLDHQLRSRADAAEVIKRVERGDTGR